MANQRFDQGLGVSGGGRLVLLKKEIDKLKKQLLSLSALVAESVDKAVLAFGRRDAELASEVVQKDSDVDNAEVELEEECLKVLALHQPVARDLRFIIAVLKINNDLERIGDLAVNIAKRVRYVQEYPQVSLPVLSEMMDEVRGMLRTSLDSFVNLDADVARNVMAMDDKVDDFNRSNFKFAQESMHQSPDQIPGIISALTVSRNLERVADHATNIAEDVIYLAEGAIVRHQHAE